MSRRQHPVPQGRQPCDLPSEKSTDSFWHTQPSPLLTAHRSTRDLPQTADVVIVGSGMTGSSVAHHLLSPSRDSNSYGKDAGPSVVMLEAREACWGATGRNGGHCQPILFEHPHDPSIGHFELANFHTLENIISSKGIDCELAVQPGVRAIYDSGHLTDVELAFLTCQETAPEIAEMMRLVTKKDELEKLRIPTAIGAVVTSVAARMWPYKFVSRILEDLLTSTELVGSFNLQTLTPVECIAPYYGDRWTVKTSRGCIVANKVVLATNAYTSHLLPEFADLIVPCRGQMSALVPLPSLSGDMRLKTSLGFMGEGVDDYLIQRPNERGGHLMFGGGRQHGPSMGTTDDSVLDEKTAQYLRTRLVDAFALPEGKATSSKPCDYCRVRRIRCSRTTSGVEPCTNCQRFCQPSCTSRKSRMSRNKKPLEFTAAREWTGIMGFSRDEHPWIGPVPDKAGVYMAAGYTGHGMPNTWLCGKFVALLLQESSATDAAKEVGLPSSYLVTRERVEDAMRMEDVEAKDWAEMERGRRRMEADRPHSGYA